MLQMPYILWYQAPAFTKHHEDMWIVFLYYLAMSKLDCTSDADWAKRVGLQDKAFKV